MKKSLNNFKTPDNYFDSFTDKLMVKLSELEPMEKKQDGFKIPDTYFDTLYSNIQTKLSIPEPKVIKLNPFKKYYYVAAIAAVAMLFLLLTFNQQTEITFDDIALSDIENYIEDNDVDFSTYELAEMLPIDELEIKDIIENQLNDEYIIDYLGDSIDNFEELNLNPNE